MGMYESIAPDWQMEKLTELMNLDFRRVNGHGDLLMVVYGLMAREYLQALLDEH